MTHAMGGKRRVNSLDALVVFCSPKGATRTAAEMIVKSLTSLSLVTEAVSICKDEERASLLELLHDSKKNIKFLFVGSPVYGFHPLPPVMDLIQRCPSLEGIHAVPFVTWGGVCSGSALFEMGTALLEKGAFLSGAMKIPAEHSMSWAFSKPFCGGRPNGEDAARIKNGVQAIYEKAVTGSTSSLVPLDLSHYTGETLSAMLEGGFETSKARFPKIGFDETLCVKCGACAEACPLACITLSPHPVIGEACVRCYNCVRVCPEGALTADFSRSEAIILERIEKLREPQETTIFS